MHGFSRGWLGSHPPVWMVLIGLNVVCYLLQAVAWVVAPGWLEHWFALSTRAVTEGHFWQFGTYMFLHGSLIHLLLNMLTLYFTGRQVEGCVGPRHFLTIYLGGGLLGGLAQLLLSWSDESAVLGASAGVCATLIAFTTLMPEMELTLLLFFVIPIRMKAKILALAFVLVSLVFILTGTGGNIGHIAHLGGGLFGWLYCRRLGYGQPLGLRERLVERRLRAERRARMTPEEFISEEIDPILEKISREGIQSLTRAERRILERGREKIVRRGMPEED